MGSHRKVTIENIYVTTMDSERVVINKRKLMKPEPKKSVPGIF